MLDVSRNLTKKEMYKFKYTNISDIALKCRYMQIRGKGLESVEIYVACS